MENWKVVTALILFFPLGLYWMFKHTDWPEKVKLLVAAFFAMVTGLAFMTEAFFPIVAILALMLSIVSLIWFVYAIIRKKQKRNALIALLFGIFMLGYIGNEINEQAVEAERIAQEEQIELERIAEEERLEQERIAEEKRREEELIKIEEEKLEAAIKSVEKLESKPSRDYYESAVKLVNDLADPDKELENRLENSLVLVEEYEVALDEAIAAADIAEQEMTRESYEKATTLASSLAVADKALTTRLNTIEDTIVAAEQKAEEERLAKEKAEKEEAERIAKEKAEQERIAQEKAAAEKRAAEQKAAEQAKANSSSSSASTSQSSQSAAPSQTPQPGLYVNQNGDGTIKGSKNGIYHIPGSTYYDRTTNVVQWFKTVEEAQAAGYRAPKR